MKLKTPLAPLLDSYDARPNGPRWMLVDESLEVLDFLASLLRTLGSAEIYKFRSGEEALNCFAFYPDDFELVITDLELAGLNGVELCRRMRNISPSVKVILSTGSAITPDQFAREAGFSAVLPKPYSATELSEVVKSVLPDEKP